MTSGPVAQIFDVRFMSMLFGIVFLGHQLGSVLGVWYGSVAPGVMAALIHPPVADHPVERLEANATT